MGVHLRFGGIVLLVLIVALLCTSAYAQTIADDTRAIRDLEDRIERSKAETIKAIQDSENRTIDTISINIDQNFGIFDTRFQQYFKESKRDFGIIIICAMVGGFVLSQIIRIQIEAGKRKATIRRVFELEEKLAFLEKDAGRLTKVVGNLQQMETKYSMNLKTLAHKKSGFSFKTIAFGVVMFCFGALLLIALFVSGVISLG